MNIFRGKWLCHPDFAEKFHPDLQSLNNDTHDEGLKNHHTLFKKVFFAGESAPSSIRISADDYYKLYINGEFVAQGPAPGYHFAYNYNELDVTPFIRQGENILTAHVYYQGLVNRVWNSGDYRQGLIADLQTGGAVVSTDESWLCARLTNYSGEIIAYDTQFAENFDSRETEYNWISAVPVDFDYIFESSPAAVLEVYKKSPESVIITKTGTILYDFGTEITATLQITAKGKAGDKIRILCAEELTEDGHARFEMRCNCRYEELWTLKDGRGTLDQYDYKAFRYAELDLSGSPGAEITEINALVRHFPFPADRCVLESSEPAINAVFELCKNTLKYGAQEVFVDCPSREKGQYAGDLTISSASHLWLTDDPRLTGKAIRNQVQSLKIAPGLLAVTPGSLLQEIADYSLQFPLLVWNYYKRFGDLEFLKSMISPCEQVIDYFKKYQRADGLLERVDGKWNLVDWPENLRDGYDFDLSIPVGPGCHNVINAFFVGCVKTVEKIKKHADVPFIPESERLADSFNKCFFRREAGLYADSEISSHASLHSNCLPVFFGIHNPENAAGIGEYLISRGLCCGVYMAYFYLKALARLGRHRELYGFITSDAPNSWGNMLAEGATTCFEAWGKDKKWNTSLCHPWASAPISLIIEDLIGLSPLPEGGYTLNPHLPEDLEHLSLKVRLNNQELILTYTNGKCSVSEI